MKTQPRPPKTLTGKADRYDRENLAIARHVLSAPELHPTITVEWARLVVEKADKRRTA